MTGTEAIKAGPPEESQTSPPLHVLCACVATSEAKYADFERRSPRPARQREGESGARGNGRLGQVRVAF